MTAEELEKKLLAGHPPILMDVRSNHEFRSGHIGGAVHAPLASLKNIASAVTSGNKETLVVLICEHGPRAQFARIILRLAGYKNLALLAGHMAFWRHSGRSIRKDK